MVSRRYHFSKQGFTLTEMAIVLAVGGLIIVGVWLFVGPVLNKVKISNLQTEMTAVVTNIRAVGAGAASLSGGVSTTMPNLINTGAIPAYMVRNPASSCTGNSPNLCADNPWGPYNPTRGTYDPSGTFQVCAWSENEGTSSGGQCSASQTQTSQFVAISLTGLSNGTCFAIVSATTGGGPTGLVDVVINNNSIAALGHTLPISTNDATTYCSQPNLQNTITYIYRLRAPS